MLSRTSKSLAWLALGSVALGGCVVHEHHTAGPPVVVRETVVVQAPPPGPEVVVKHAPPPPRFETAPRSPGPVYVWVAGAWVWRGKWVWERGHWVQPPRVGAVWVPPCYVYRGGTYVWIPGGWR